MGVSTDGDVALCHRFAGSDDHSLGNVRDGVSWEKQQAFLDSRITSRTRPTARPAGRGRSAPAAAITKRTRATDRPNRPNLHYCEWIRGWTHTCLEIYGEIAEKNPEFLRQFDDEEVPEKVS